MNIADEARKFQKIIDDFNKVNSCTSSCSRAVNPEKRLLENHGIIYPETAAKTYDVQARQIPVVNDENVWDSYSRKVPPKKRFRLDWVKYSSLYVNFLISRIYLWLVFAKHATLNIVFYKTCCQLVLLWSKNHIILFFSSFLSHEK